MNRTIAQESDDDFENDSLENDSYDHEFDVDEVPESPLQPNNSAIDDEEEEEEEPQDDGDLRPRLKKKCLVDNWFAKKTTSIGRSLPNGIKLFGDDGKILDFRTKTSRAIFKFNRYFGKTTVQDFKEGKIRSSAVINDDNRSVAEKMKSVKQVFTILLDKLEESPNNKKFNFRSDEAGSCSQSTIAFPENSPTKEMDKDSLADSMESDPDESKSGPNLVQTRKSKLHGSAAILADETQMEDDSLDSDSGDDQFMKSKKINNHNNNNKMIEPNESPEMKFVVYQNEKKNVHPNKIITPPVFLGNPVHCQKLFKQLCQHCQNYYSQRKLTPQEISVLLERCDKHRGYRTRYKSPPRFWDIDFHFDDQ